MVVANYHNWLQNEAEQLWKKMDATHTHTLALSRIYTHSLKALISSSLFHHTLSACRHLQQREPEVCGSASRGCRCGRLAFHTPLTINPDTLTIIQTILFQRHICEDPFRGGFLTSNCGYLGIKEATFSWLYFRNNIIFLHVCILEADCDITAPTACADLLLRLCCYTQRRVVF